MEYNSEEFEDDPILYELLEYFVKKQDPELIKCKNDAALLSTTGTIKNALRYLNNRYSLPESISQQTSLTLPWKFAIDEYNRLLAILKENYLEIRKSKDEFSSVIAKGTVPKDAFPQWRKLSWSPDGSLLVLASSNGSISFYNSLGNYIFSITRKTVSQNPDILEAGDAVCCFMFNPLKENDKWPYEFLVITYSGLLKSYSISGTHGFKYNYEFSFGNFYRKGVNAFAYDKIHNLYIVAGNSITQSDISQTATSHGLTSWRPLNDYPYYKLSFNFDETSASPLSLWNLIPTFRTPPTPVICRISISPSCNSLICLHTDGCISLWDLPNLKLRKKWKLNEQPGFDAHNPLAMKKVKKFPTGVTEFHPIDIGWWSEHAVIIARYSGAVSVCSINQLKNVLGASPEFLYGQPQISKFFLGKGFLALDCETLITSKKIKQITNQDGSVVDVSDSDQEEDELEPISLTDYFINLVKGAIYSITDIERFQPKRKKSQILQRTYRLLGLKSTTPEELYARKIDIEEYEDALNLANTYNLDTDLVYQTQWRKSEFSLNAIKEHLSKVSQRSWVLNECIMRVPETLEVAKELLNFGLRGANLETFLNIAEEDDGKFVDEELNNELSLLNHASSNLKHIQKTNDLLKRIDLSKLTDPQKELINHRRKLLDHRDNLKTYEIIIEDASEYTKEFYEKFRSQSVVENTIEFAKDCNYKAVEIMFMYHAAKLMPHWLGIISCFPECLNPKKYEKLLPKCDDDGQLFLLYQKELRPKDWTERHEFEDVIEKKATDGSEIMYDADSSLSIYKNTELTMNLLNKWYKSRAYQIERDSCIVENALELIKIAKNNKITGLEQLLVELETLYDVIYKVYLEEMSLARLEKLSDLEKIKLLMSKTSADDFISHIKNYILPFLYRRRDYLGVDLEKKYFHDYLVSLSENDLTFTAIFMKNLSQDIKILEAVEDVMALALNCIYACTNPDMYEKAREIFESVSKPNPTDFSRMHNPLDDLEKELDCLKILNKYNVISTVRFINENKSQVDEVKVLLTEMANYLTKISPPVNQAVWSELLNDILELQGWIFPCIDPEICFEICVTNKLLSGIKSSIQDCNNLIETRKKEDSLLKVSYSRAVELILEASKEYFNLSKTLHDPMMELAKACLNLIEDENKLIQEEFDLINALQVLDEFSINILPLEIRNCQDKLKLIENCINISEIAYKRQQRLLTLGSYLHIDDHNQISREGKILQLIAIKSFKIEDFSICASTCKQLIESSYFPAWSVIEKLAFSNNYHDLEFKKQCFWFIITYGPSEILEESLRQVHLLEIQLLNKNLENWMTIHELDDVGNDDDSEEDFTDALTTPQMEIKDFVPKIFETSTDLVKNSAQILKGSLGILKNVSNQSFWKSALNINSKSIWEDTYETDENVTQEKYRGEIQSFPFFYQSLHDWCLISRIDTKYSKYSQPDIDNTKLKMCQILLRVALLSETASYGHAISNINHFFMQSCSHVLPDDWTLGFAYLLSFKENASGMEELFETLPMTDLYLQTIIYFYSVQLYRFLNPEDEKYLLYDPMKLMENMVKMLDNVEDNKYKRSLVYWYKRLNKKKEERQAEDEEEVRRHEVIKVEEVSQLKQIEVIEKLEPIDNEGKMENSQEEVAEGWDNDDWGDDFPEKPAEQIADEITRKNDRDELTVPEGFDVSLNQPENLYEKEIFKMSKEEEAAWGDDVDFNDAHLLIEHSDLSEKNMEEGKVIPGTLESFDDDKNKKKVDNQYDEWGEEAGWGDDWPDDPEESLVNTLEHKKDEENELSLHEEEPKQIEVEEKQQMEEINSETQQNQDENHEETKQLIEKSSQVQQWVEGEAGWDDWEDFTIEEQKQDPKDDICHSPSFVNCPKKSILSINNSFPVVNDSTEEERFQIFEDLFTCMETTDEYMKLKEVLVKWPNFELPKFTCLAKNPILRMISAASRFITKHTHSECETAILEEYRDLLKIHKIPEEIFQNFIKEFDIKCSLEGQIFLRLFTKDVALHEEAIDAMKSLGKVNFPLPILEQVFFNNRTSSFPPHHPIYNRILEQIFLNHDLSEVEPNIRLLIKQLMKQRHIPYAVALWNQLAAVPPALSTFENSFQLLMKD